MVIINYALSPPSWGRTFTNLGQPPRTNSVECFQSAINWFEPALNPDARARSASAMRAIFAVAPSVWLCPFLNGIFGVICRQAHTVNERVNPTRRTTFMFELLDFILCSGVRI